MLSSLHPELRLPLIQAPMAGVQNSRLAIAVSQAGGLGSLPAAMLSAEDLDSELTTLSQATQGPFNINFFAHQQPQPDATKQAKWQTLLRPYYDELGLSEADIPTGGGRRPFDADSAQVLEKHRPSIVSFHFGLPEPVLLDRVKSLGSRVLGCATTVEEAIWLEQHGADLIVAQGLEAGGHRGMFLSEDLTGQQGTLSLVPQVVEAVSVPVIAAGGIASPEGVKAVLELGACAAQVGTSYLLCRESRTSAIHRRLLQSAKGRHTAITNLFSGKPARGIVNRLMRELGPLRDDVDDFPYAAAAIAPLRQAAEARNLGEFTPLWAGQNVSGCREIGAAEMTSWLVSALD